MLDGRLRRTVAARWVARHRRRIAAAAVGVGLSAALLLSVVPGARRAFLSPNLAVGKEWRASSAFEGWEGRGIVPEDAAPSALFHTREEHSPWVIVDLGSARRVRRVEVENRRDSYANRAFPLAIEVSMDASAWKRVAYRRVEFRNWDASFNPTEARFVRLRVDRFSYLHPPSPGSPFISDGSSKSAAARPGRSRETGWSFPRCVLAVYAGWPGLSCPGTLAVMRRALGAVHCVAVLLGAAVSACNRLRQLRTSRTPARVPMLPMLPMLPTCRSRPGAWAAVARPGRVVAAGPAARPAARAGREQPAQYRHHLCRRPGVRRHGRLRGAVRDDIPAPTPHLDSLAAEGLMFTQAHSSNGVCSPSRYALLTGKYNWRTFSDVSWGYAAPDIPSGDTTLAEFLKTQGYDTAGLRQVAPRRLSP